MHNGFKKLALGITGVALLSGTAFATGPTIESPPTLIITDRLSAGAIADGAGPWDDGNPGGSTSGSFNIFDFTGAITLSDYVSAPLAPGGLNDVNWDFVELDPSDDSVITSGQTIQITDGTNSSLGQAAEPVFADLDGGTAFNPVGSNDPLDFRNVVRTTGSGPAVGNFLDQTRIKLFAATNADPLSSVASTTFDVYTTNDIAVAEGDQFSIPSTVFVPVEGFDDMGGWYEVQRFDQAAIFDVSPIRFSTSFGNLPDSVPARASLDSTVSEFNAAITRLTVPASTATLSMSTDTVAAGAGATNPFLTEFAPQLIGFGSFFEDIPSTANDSVAVTADTLYMIRWDLSTPFTTSQGAQLPLAQLIVGETGAYGLGRSLVSFDNNGDNNLVGANLAFRQYFYAHDSGDIGFFMNLFDQATAGTTAANEGFPQGHVGHNVTINRVDVFEVQTAGLTGESVIFNQGQASVPLVSGEPTPPATGVAQFDLDAWTGRDGFAGIGTNAARNVSFTPSVPLNGAGTARPDTGAVADILSMTIGATGAGPLNMIWDTFNTLSINGSEPAVDASISEIFELDEGTLVFMDYWLSATGSTAQLPFTRVGMGSANVIPGGGTDNDSIQGYVAFQEFTPRSTVFGLADGTTAAPAIGLQAGSARRARLVWEVQLTTSAGATGGGQYAFRPVMESFVIPAATPSDESNAIGTVNLHRVVVTTYDPPTGAETASVPPSLTDL